MGKAVLLLFTAIVVSTTFVGLNQNALRQMSDATHSVPQAQSTARNYAETARSAVVSAMVGSATFRDRNDVAADIGMDGGGAVAYGGGHYALTDYSLNSGRDTVSFTVTGQAYHTRRKDASGATGWSYVRHSIRSLFAMEAPTLSCLPISGSHILMNLNEDANLNCPTTYEPIVNAARYEDYNLREVFDIPVAQVLADHKEKIEETDGNKGGGAQTLADTSFLADRGVPLGDDIISAVSDRTCNPAASVTFNGGYTTVDNRNYGYNGGQPRVVHVRGDLTIQADHSFSGTGLLFVEGDLTVLGRLRWKGIVYARSGNDLMKVDLDNARRVDIDGSLLVDHDAPPAGGHMDLTAVRRLDGDWTTPASDSTDRQWGNGKPWFEHTHRYSSANSAGTEGTARVIFRDNRVALNQDGEHESYTHFHDTLTRLDTTEVYLQLDNFRNTGAGLIGAILNGVKCSGSIRRGFGDACAAPGNPHRTRTFRATQLDSLGFTVRSLRLLSKHIDREPINDPTGEVMGCSAPYPDPIALQVRNGQCTSNDRPMTVAGLYNRDGALRIQIRRKHDDAILYEAMPYWHSKHDGHSQHEDEEEEWNDWVAQVRAGGFYGLEFDANHRLDVSMSPNLVEETLQCLGIGDTEVTHVSTVSYAEAPHTETEQECDAYDNGIGNGLDCAPGNSGTTPGGGGGIPGGGGGIPGGGGGIPGGGGGIPNP